jgi:DNA repair protein RecN (Recombination protein N)
VLSRQEAFRKERDVLEQGDDVLVALERQYDAARHAYLSAARVLAEARRTAAGRFARRLEGLVAELAMERTRFEVRFSGELPESDWAATGVESGEFFVSPNPGEDLRPLARIVSGGELSRIMLALKTLTTMSRHDVADPDGQVVSGAAPGLIFDEVDAGLGGKVADVLGRKLHGLGTAYQVLCITHLPQVAAHADAHFLVEKHVEQGRTRAAIRKLTGEHRVDELGRMLGGAHVTDGIRASAREMLASRALSQRLPRTNGGGESERAKAKVGRETRGKEISH